LCRFRDIVSRNFAKVFDTHKTRMIGLPCDEETITIFELFHIVTSV